MSRDKNDRPPKVIVIGLDGATWDLIKPWAEEGKLQTLKRLMAVSYTHLTLPTN